MSYTLSFDASPEAKCQKGKLKGYLHHQARDIDKANGEEVRHSNENIDPARTAKNRSWVRDLQTGKFHRPASVDEIESTIFDRLQTVTGKVQKNSVVVRGLLVELDPAWTKDHPGKNPINDILPWLSETFGRENIVAIFEHNDETSRHYHVAFTPITKDGRLSQKDFFPNPGSLRKLHDSFREHMISRGYDIELERQPPRKHMKDKEYKTFREAKKVAKRLDAREAAVKAKEAALEAQEQALKEQEARIQAQAENARKTALEADRRLSEVNDRELRLEEREARFRKQEDLLKTDTIQTVGDLTKRLGEAVACLQRRRTVRRDDPEQTAIRRAEHRLQEAEDFFQDSPGSRGLSLDALIAGATAQSQAERDQAKGRFTRHRSEELGW